MSLIAAALLSLSAAAANLRYAEDLAPGTVNPLFGSSMAEARANELLFESLYADDTDLASAPRLAESGELSPDRRVMTVRLRRDVTWHDGRPFTADDVVFTVGAMKDPTTASTEVGRVAFIEAVQKVDANTVRLTFVRPEVKPEDKLHFKILPAHAFPGGTSVKRGDPFRSAPIGTGPYRLARFNDDHSVSFEAVPNWRKPVGIQQVTLREVADKSYQTKLLMYESLEALVRVMPRDLAVLRGNRAVELYPYQTNSWWYLGFNQSRAVWADPEVRAAVARFVDVPGLLAPVGTGERVTGPFVPSSPFYNHDVVAPPTDPAEGARRLEAAGWTRGPTGWSKGGKPLAITVSAHRALDSAQEVAINLQSQLGRHGVTVQLELLDEADWKARVWRDRSFDVVLSQWTFDRNEDVREQLHSAGSRNFVGYANPAVDALLDEARDAADPWARKQAMREVHAAVAADQPMVFLWTLAHYAALSTKVRAALIHPFSFFTWLPGWTMK